MTSETTGSTRILLKARPTVPQLADRLAAPAPEGLELYLDRADLTAEDWLDRIRVAVEECGAPTDFVWIVEAPIRTLGGAYFDLTRDDADHRETIARVIRAGATIGAVAANVHIVAPTTSATELTADNRQRALKQALPFVRFYVKGCIDAGLVPQIENIPPVGRMRESAFVFSAIGTTPDDLLAVHDLVPDVRFTVDVSHAALAVNWQNVALSDVVPDLRPVATYARAIATAMDLTAWVASAADLTTTVHVSNASGLLGEGLGYAEGDENLDRTLKTLVGSVPYFVTETLEVNPEHATGMRETQSRLQALRAAHQVQGN